MTAVIGLVIMAVAVAVPLYLGRRQSGVSFDGNALIEKLLSTQSERDAAQSRVGRLETDLETKEDERKRTQAALDDLLARQDSPDPPPGIDDALRLIDEKGDSAAAEDIFREIAERKKKEGGAAHREAARALRHLGALAFLHDSEKALAAYAEAVQLDPGDADGWN
jgi:tetratricopeptide (TPR) repeat protein